MNIPCNQCDNGRLVCDFKKAHFLVIYDKNLDKGVSGVEFEESSYEAEEGNEVYCDTCGEFYSRTKLENIISEMKTYEAHK